MKTGEDFRHRRAKSGCGILKKSLLNELWHANNDITHYIIGQLPDKVAEMIAIRDFIYIRLQGITHEPPDHVRS